MKLRDIKKSFGAAGVLRDIDIDVLEVEFVASVGPSGWCKSFFLQLVCGLNEITGGQMAVTAKS